MPILPAAVLDTTTLSATSPVTLVAVAASAAVLTSA